MITDTPIRGLQHKNSCGRLLLVSPPRVISTWRSRCSLAPRQIQRVGGKKKCRQEFANNFAMHEKRKCKKMKSFEICLSTKEPVHSFLNMGDPLFMLLRIQLC